MPCVINLSEEYYFNKSQVASVDDSLFAESGQNAVKFIFRYFYKIDYTFHANKCLERKHAKAYRRN